jgi:predicted RNA-binding Zn ribbon-like protein
MFIADARGLDFLNSVATPWGAEIEWLGDGRDLLAWLEPAGLVPADVAKAMRRDATPAALDAVATQARALREWFRSFVVAHAGKPIEADALAELGPLNRLLERDEAYGEIVASRAGAPALRWRWNRRWRAPDDLLAPIAQVLSELVCDADFTLVKNCEGPTCSMLFLDISKAHTRRWCSMAMCGNRAKQAAHRSRASDAAGR